MGRLVEELSFQEQAMEQNLVEMLRILKLEEYTRQAMNILGMEEFRAVCELVEQKTQIWSLNQYEVIPDWVRKLTQLLCAARNIIDADSFHHREAWKVWLNVMQLAEIIEPQHAKYIYGISMLSFARDIVTALLADGVLLKIEKDSSVDDES